MITCTEIEVDWIALATGRKQDVLICLHVCFYPNNFHECIYRLLSLRSRQQQCNCVFTVSYLVIAPFRFVGLTEILYRLWAFSIESSTKEGQTNKQTPWPLVRKRTIPTE
jgi:hypothetical protein